MTTKVQPEAIARGVLESISDDRLILSIPGTDYRLELVPGVEPARLTTPVGKKIKGVIHANALRIHPATRGGGRFIEPVYGMPRIVAGYVISADPDHNEAVIDLTVPFVVRTLPEQDFSIIQPGRLVNFYVESGATFTPLDALED